MEDIILAQENTLAELKSDQIKDRLIATISHIIPEISRKTGWKDQVIRRWINGSLPRIDKIEELCQAANISIVWLITGVGYDVEQKFAISDTKQEANMTLQDDMTISKKMGIGVLDLHEILSKFEKLDARELNLVAMQLINRAVITMEQP